MHEVTTGDEAARKRRRLDRVNQACNLCRSRKVKCDGNWPCSYCSRRDLSDTCIFATADQQHHGPQTPASAHQSPRPLQTNANTQVNRRSTIGSTDGMSNAGNDTAVPLAGQLLRDAEGKSVFIGDCAPLSFLRAVRQLVTPDIDPSARFSRVCQANPTDDMARPGTIRSESLPPVHPNLVSPLLSRYTTAASGLVDVFDLAILSSELETWSSGQKYTKDIASAVCCLILAIGAQDTHDSRAAVWFEYSKSILQDELCDNMNVQIVQGYTLIALYMLRAFKPNASYLYFSLAARSAYAIGLHRAEVNASFDRSQQKLRDKIWKSLRVFDLLLSCLLGRPPCISDADDTHRRKHQTTTHDNLDILEASLSLSVILEQVVVQVYTRKHISVKVAQFVSDQLKAWALVWLKPLMDALRPAGTQASSSEQIAGALQVVSSYLYSITLLARPFLIYDVYDSLETSHTRAPTTQVDERSKKKIADGAIDAAITLVTLVQDLITNDKMPAIAPGIVPWLFTASLVLGLGILGRYGHALTKQAQTAVQCLEYFGTADPHARQYASIVQVLVETSDEWIRRREPHFRDKLKQASSELFGLTSSVGDSPRIRRQELSSPAPTRNTTNVALPANMTSFQVDTALNPLSFPWSAEDDQSLQEFLRPTGPNYGFAMEDSFFPIDDSTSAFLTEDMT